MLLTLASQIGADFDTLAAARPGIGKVISLPTDDLPLDRIMQEADALIVRPGPLWRKIAARGRPDSWPGRIRWVQSASAGVDFYPEWLGEAPWFSCGRGVASEQIADYVIGALYARLKPFETLAIRRAEDWVHRPIDSLIGRRVAILGLGSIGLAVARRLIALGAHPVGVRRSSREDSADGIERAASLEQAVTSADDIVIALPATPETRGIVNGKLLGHVRPGAHLVNIARGSIVDQEELIRALDDGRLGFATLDVTDPEPLPAGHPLYTHPRVRITPHISSNWQGILPALYERLLANIDAVAHDIPPEDLVLRSRGY
ncbi:MAG TPA: NAD(P)-dependent oxidoreductase [Sphingobium sp.]|uniref:NAD(P)-dependent oxidoreductase n=1 Tax=Sphingobium sp. TaxID=1912891 RepID=UPI002ED0161B